MSEKGRSLKRKPVWTIGWKETIDLPELNLFGIKAKTDTGALTSVLHCSKIKVINRDGQVWVEFIPLKNPKQEGAQVFTFPYEGEKKIKNSFGQKESRYFIKTKIRLFNQEFPIELTLRDRSKMEFPMLLGKSFIKGKFIVDVSQSFVSAKTIAHFQ